MPSRLAWLLTGVLASPLTAAAQLPLGPEFVVNVVTSNAQARPSVTVYGAGVFIVAWEGFDAGPAGNDVSSRIYSASGGPFAGEFTVNTYTTGTQYHARVAADPNGNFMVVWEANEPYFNFNVYARRYESLDVPQGPEFRVNTFSAGDQRAPAVSADATGRFVVVWHSAGQDGSDLGVFAQRYDATGAPLGPEFRVNAFTSGRQANPGVAWQGSAGFVVAWESDLADGAGLGIRARRFDENGVPLGLEFSVNSYTTASQTRPAVAADPAGSFVVAWTSAFQETGGPADTGIFAQRFDAGGARVGGEFHVNTYTTGYQAYPALALDGTGDFVVAWHSQNEDGDAQGVFARRYHSSGAAEGGPFQINSYTTQAQFGPSVAAEADGDFVVAWHSPQDGSGAAVVARRFRPDVIFQDGFEGGASSAWSLSATDGGDLTVSPAAALRASTFGLQGVVDDTAGLYVQDDSPDAEKHYRARFHFDPNGFDPGESLNHRRTRIFIAFASPNRRVAAIVLRRLGGSYSVMARARLDDNTQASTSFFPITDEPHSVEIRLAGATGPDTLDGALVLYIDGTQVTELNLLDNSLTAVDFARLGALSVKTGAGGTLYWDEFQSRRFGFIGS
jgi:hypothetical protein